MPALGTIKPTLRKTGSSDIASPPAGWVGSKAAAKGDFVTVDTNGRVDQAVGLGANVGAATRLAFLASPTTILSSAAVSTVFPEIEKFDEDTLIELPVTSDDTAIATTAAMIGKQYEIRRTTTTGFYTVNTNAVTNVKVEVVALSPRFNLGEVGGTVLCRVLPAARIA